jgi:hypothetical protein
MISETVEGFRVDFNSVDFDPELRRSYESPGVEIESEISVDSSGG